MKHLALVFLLLALVAILPVKSQAREIFVHGTVHWVSNTPAEGLTVKLVKEGQVMATTLTNARGVYVFYDLPGQPRDYVLRIMDRIEPLKEQALPDIAVGSKLADIRVE